MNAESNYTLCLLGSPRRDGNSDALAAHFCKHAEQSGANVEQIPLIDLSYNGCINLFHCKKDLDHCGQNDGLTSVLNKMGNAEQTRWLKWR